MFFWDTYPQILEICGCSMFRLAFQRGDFLFAEPQKLKIFRLRHKTNILSCLQCILKKCRPLGRRKFGDKKFGDNIYAEKRIILCWKRLKNTGLVTTHQCSTCNLQSGRLYFPFQRHKKTWIFIKYAQTGEKSIQKSSRTLQLTRIGETRSVNISSIWNRRTFLVVRYNHTVPGSNRLHIFGHNRHNVISTKIDHFFCWVSWTNKTSQISDS